HDDAIMNTYSIMRIIICSIFVITIIVSCSHPNYQIAKQIVTKGGEASSLEEIIRTDGYYYFDSDGQSYQPVVFINDGKLYKYPFVYDNHNEIQNGLKTNAP